MQNVILSIAVLAITFSAAGVHGLLTSGFPNTVLNTILPRQGLPHQPRILFGLKYFQLQSTRQKFRTPRAMLDVGNLFNGVNPPSERVLKAVESAGRRVTVADVASAVGMSLNDAQKELSTMALLTGGTLQISENGDIVYNFERNFRNTLRARYTNHMFYVTLRNA
jgi:hypothetical protein